MGEVVAENPTALEGDGVKALFEHILLTETGADLAYYRGESVAGRLRAGTIRTGDIYDLESWGERVSVVEIKGADLSPALLAAIRARGDTVHSGSTYEVATTSYIAENLADELIGPIGAEATGAMLRDVAISHLTAKGFPHSV